MAYIYYFNPDGTLATMPATHNVDGSLRPAGSYSSYSPYNTPSGHTSSRKSSSNISMSKSTKTQKAVAKCKKLYSSIGDVDKLLNSWKQCKLLISEKSLRKARNRINSVSIRNYFEQKLSEFLKQGLIKTNETNLISTNKRELDQDELVSKQQVDEILNKLFKETSVPAITILDKIRKRIISFSLKDYFDRKINEYRLRKDNCRRITNTPQKVTTKTASIPPTTICTSPKHNTIISSRSEIDNIVNTWIKCNGRISPKAVKKTKEKIPSSDLLAYLDQKVQEYTKEKITTHTKTISTISTVSKKNKIKSSVDNIIVSHTGGRKPKYGYARDYFGRIQERDHYIENRSINSYHDNSNYDREDDHDSMYSEFE